MLEFQSYLKRHTKPWLEFYRILCCTLENYFTNVENDARACVLMLVLRSFFGACACARILLLIVVWLSAIHTSVCVSICTLLLLLSSFAKVYRCVSLTALLCRRACRLQFMVSVVLSSRIVSVQISINRQQQTRARCCQTSSHSFVYLHSAYDYCFSKQQRNSFLQDWCPNFFVIV